MKKIIPILMIMVSCGPSQEEINKKRSLDSMNVVIKQHAYKDSVNMVNGKRQADSIANEISKAIGN